MEDKRLNGTENCRYTIVSSKNFTIVHVLCKINFKMNNLILLGAFFLCILQLKLSSAQNFIGLKPCPVIPSTYTKPVDQVISPSST